MMLIGPGAKAYSAAPCEVHRTLRLDLMSGSVQLWLKRAGLADERLDTEVKAASFAVNREQTRGHERIHNMLTLPMQV